MRLALSESGQVNKRVLMHKCSVRSGTPLPVEITPHATHDQVFVPYTIRSDGPLCLVLGNSVTVRRVTSGEGRASHVAPRYTVHLCALIMCATLCSP